jgi:hypothetical protein
MLAHKLAPLAVGLALFLATGSYALTATDSARDVQWPTPTSRARLLPSTALYLHRDGEGSVASRLENMQVMLIQQVVDVRGTLKTTFVVDYRIYNSTQNQSLNNRAGKDNLVVLDFYDADGNLILTSGASFNMGRSECRYGDAPKNMHHEGWVTENYYDTIATYKIRAIGGDMREGLC